MVFSQNLKKTRFGPQTFSVTCNNNTFISLHPLKLHKFFMKYCLFLCYSNYASSQASVELQTVVSNKEALLQQVKLLTDSEHQLVRRGWGGGGGSGAGMLFSTLYIIPAEKSVRLINAKTKGY